MRKILAIFFALVLLAGCGNPHSVEAGVGFDDDPVVMNDGEMKETGDSMAPSVNRLGMEMVRLLMEENPDGNHLVSPLSLSIALGMLQNGAEGETREQILALIGEAESVNRDNKAIISRLNGMNGEALKLAIANSLWVRDDMTPKQSFVDALAGWYDADMFAVDFLQQKTIDDMNVWVEKKTEGMLKDTLKSLDANTLAVLMNTVYFKGTWVNEFSEENTDEADFFVAPDLTKKVDMMHMTDKIRYYENEDCQVVYLPYEGDMEMAVILPKGDVTVWMDELTSGELESLLRGDEAREAEVVLSLPKFEYEVGNELKDVLMAMGMTNAFDPDRAEFPSIVEEELQIWVSRIFQNAKIILDEKGTEAAAVTVIVMELTSAVVDEEKPVIMNCDRPFFYAIKDNGTDLPLFMGVYNAYEK